MKSAGEKREKWGEGENSKQQTGKMKVREKRREGVLTIRKRFLLSVSLSLFPFTRHLYQSSGLSDLMEVKLRIEAESRREDY